jgi:hypothetical protein
MNILNKIRTVSNLFTAAGINVKYNCDNTVLDKTDIFNSKCSTTWIYAQEMIKTKIYKKKQLNYINKCLKKLFNQLGRESIDKTKLLFVLSNVDNIPNFIDIYNTLIKMIKK